MKNDIHDLALVACWVSSTKRHASPMSEGCRISSVGWVSAGGVHGREQGGYAARRGAGGCPGWRQAQSREPDQQVLLDCIRATSPLSVVMAEALGNRRAVLA